jgi:hypothetical protein
MALRNTFRIDLLGTSLSIAADKDDVYLQRLLDRYKTAIENTQKATGLQDPLKLALITGFLLCDEVQKLQIKRGVSSPLFGNEPDEAEKLIMDLNNRIDAALERST